MARLGIYSPRVKPSEWTLPPDWFDRVREATGVEFGIFEPIFIEDIIRDMRFRRDRAAVEATAGQTAEILKKHVRGLEALGQQLNSLDQDDANFDAAERYLNLAVARHFKELPSHMGHFATGGFEDLLQLRIEAAHRALDEVEKLSRRGRDDVHFYDEGIGNIAELFHLCGGQLFQENNGRLSGSFAKLLRMIFEVAELGQRIQFESFRKRASVIAKATHAPAR